MNLLKIFNFFLEKITFSNLIQVLINFVLIFSIIFVELLFISVFFLLLNQFNDSQVFSFIFNFIADNTTYLRKSFSLTETYLLILIFLLIIKNILALFQRYYYSKLVHMIASEKSSEILNFYLNKNFDLFSKKELSTYTKQIVRDVENVFLGIFGLIISLIGELIYVLVLLIYTSKLVEFKFSISMLMLIIIVISYLYFLYEKANF